MASKNTDSSLATAVRPAATVLVATTAMLAFISYWRAAAVVLNDLGSSAFYAGAIAEHFMGKTAPWFILAIMLFAFAVQRALLRELRHVRARRRLSSSEGGHGRDAGQVFRVGVDVRLHPHRPDQRRVRGVYLVGLLNELLRYAHFNLVLPVNATAAVFAVLVTLYFWWENIKGIPESSEKALRIMYVTTVMVILMIAWCTYTLWVRGFHLPPLAHLSNLTYSTMRSVAAPHFAAIHGRLDRHFDRSGPFGSGHERRRNDGAGLPRNRASQAAQPEKSGLGDFSLQPDFHGGCGVFRGDDYSGFGARQFLR